jgi:hypothetical protein
MTFKTLLQEIEDKFNEVNQLEEFATSNMYYTSIPAGSKTNALNVIKSNELLRLLILNKQLIYRLDMNEIIFESEHEKAIDLLNSKLHKAEISIINSTSKNVPSMTEASTSAGAGAYLTPNAFGHEAPESAITAFGMKKTGKPNKNTKSLKELDYRKMMSEMYSILEEGKYNDIKNDPAVSPKKKVNYAIAEVYTKLYEIEKIISKSMKLKNEMNIDNRMYWKPTKEKLSKLSERLNRVSSYLKNLSA